MKSTFPGFFGSITAGPDHPRMRHRFNSGEGQLACEFPSPRMIVWTTATNSPELCSYGTANEKLGRPTLFVWGHPLVGSDCEFDEQTRVDRVSASCLTNSISRLYQACGVRAFSRLEGEFCLIVADPQLSSIFLVSDKFGCFDISFRRTAMGLDLASDPAVLADFTDKLNPITSAFYLAHEGFVPAPFTLFESVATVGRGSFLRITEIDRRLSVERHRYWEPSRASARLTRRDALSRFKPVLTSAVESRRRQSNAILLSGGMDSTLLANLLANSHGSSLIAVTGAIRGHGASENEMRCASKLSSALGIRHHPVWIDPADENLPDGWRKCCESWSNGTRITLPLFHRFAIELAGILGDSFSAYSGQMADTLADNNYTLSSPGYTLRRLLFSPLFFAAMRKVRIVVPRNESAFRKIFVSAVRLCAGSRASRILASILDGMRSTDKFYAGRVFGFAEMPGLAPERFPVLSSAGFDCLVDWYDFHFLSPALSRITASNFYQQMLELSLDMCMLHLDTRLVLHAFRLGGGSAELPFLDSRVVNFFMNLPDSARAFYRRPKDVIRRQFTMHRYLRGPISLRSQKTLSFREGAKSKDISFEEALLKGKGALGSYFRELLRGVSLFDQVKGIGDFLDENYCHTQLQSFLQSKSGIDYKFISRLAALEVWQRNAFVRAQPASVCAMV